MFNLIYGWWYAKVKMPFEIRVLHILVYGRAYWGNQCKKDYENGLHLGTKRDFKRAMSHIDIWHTSITLVDKYLDHMTKTCETFTEWMHKMGMDLT